MYHEGICLVVKGNCVKFIGTIISSSTNLPLAPPQGPGGKRKKPCGSHRPWRGRDGGSTCGRPGAMSHVQIHCPPLHHWPGHSYVPLSLHHMSGCFCESEKSSESLITDEQL